MRIGIAIILVGSLLLVTAACTSIQPQVAEIPAAIANASTAADHQRIADYFAQKAASYDAEAASHEKMGRSYFSRPKGDAALWASHCNSLKKTFEDAAKEARALEQAHRQLANSMSK